MGVLVVCLGEVRLVGRRMGLLDCSWHQSELGDH